MPDEFAKGAKEYLTGKELFVNEQVYLALPIKIEKRLAIHERDWNRIKEDLKNIIDIARSISGFTYFLFGAFVSILPAAAPLFFKSSVPSLPPAPVPPVTVPPASILWWPDMVYIIIFFVALSLGIVSLINDSYQYNKRISDIKRIQTHMNNIESVLLDVETSYDVKTSPTTQNGLVSDAPGGSPTDEVAPPLGPAAEE